MLQFYSYSDPMKNGIDFYGSQNEHEIESILNKRLANVHLRIPNIALRQTRNLIHIDWLWKSFPVVMHNLFASKVENINWITIKSYWNHAIQAKAFIFDFVLFLLMTASPFSFSFELKIIGQRFDRISRFVGSQYNRLRSFQERLLLMKTTIKGKVLSLAHKHIQLAREDEENSIKISICVEIGWKEHWRSTSNTFINVTVKIQTAWKLFKIKCLKRN